ncbi:MAG: type II toxin-antitoxin system RelE/ParE family toxin [Anaerolineaceae bacterium]|nr:type II toxin-antitoxin system RelE/ParE family toxin [Anaerolineaceae bacterium]
MKQYKVIILSEAQRDLQKRIDYIVFVLKNKQAAKRVMLDYHQTINTLSHIAGSIRISDNELLRERNLKRLNFHKHDYYLLFKIEEDKVKVTNIFHGWEDVEEKLK